MAERNKTRTVTRLQVLVPCMIAAFAIADVGLRAIPPKRLVFRGWEAASFHPDGEGPFVRNFHYYAENSYGDIPNIGNLPSFRQFRPQTFNTDAWGYRITPFEPGAPIRAVIFGDSFAAGAGNSDAETLSAQLARMTHTGVYNAGQGSRSSEAILSLVKRLNLRNGLVIYAQSEDSAAPRLPEYQPGTGDKRLDSLRQWIHRYSNYSPLRIGVRWAFLRIRNDVWLPNPSAANVAVRRLKNGQPFLFLPRGVDTDRFTGAEYLADLNTRIRDTGNALLVVLVPFKDTVYSPLLEETRAGKEAGPLFLGRMAENLRQAGVPVIDLTPILREQAAQLLAEGKYNYWPDDTHWNSLGIARAAQAIVEYQALR